VSPFFVQSALFFFKAVSCCFCDVTKVEYGLLLNEPRRVDDETTLREACIVECSSSARGRSTLRRGRCTTTNLARMRSDESHARTSRTR